MLRGLFLERHGIGKDHGTDGANVLNPREPEHRAIEGPLVSPRDTVAPRRTLHLLSFCGLLDKRDLIAVKLIRSTYSVIEILVVVVLQANWLTVTGLERAERWLGRWVAATKRYQGHSEANDDEGQPFSDFPFSSLPLLGG